MELSSCIGSQVTLSLCSCTLNSTVKTWFYRVDPHEVGIFMGERYFLPEGDFNVLTAPKKGK